MSVTAWPMKASSLASSISVALIVPPLSHADGRGNQAAVGQTNHHATTVSTESVTQRRICVRRAAGTVEPPPDQSPAGRQSGYERSPRPRRGQLLRLAARTGERICLL